MSHFWPPSEQSQHDYERLRSVVVGTGATADDLAAARFARRGLAGLITWPDAEPVFSASVIGATRPPWTPYGDPRLCAVAAAYRLLLEGPQRRQFSTDHIITASGGRR
jgi:hypothetical protein